MFHWISRELLYSCAGAFLLFLGVAQLYRSGKAVVAEISKEKPRQTALSPVRDFFTGAFMCGSNPAFFMFWLFVTDELSQRLEGAMTLPTVVMFLFGILLGDLLWFRVMLRLALKGSEYLNQQKTMLLRKSIAWCFVALGIYGLTKEILV